MPARVTFVIPGGGFSLGRRPHEIFKELVARGLELEAVADGEFEPTREREWVFLRGTAGWYPRTVERLAKLPPDQRARVLLWVTEPLPPPRASGLPPSRLSLRDVAKLVLRDARANDQRTNLRRTLSLREAFPDAVVAVTTRAKVETLAERGIDVPLVPLGTRYARDQPGAVDPVDRDVDVLFVGDLNVPHRRRALRRLDRAGVNVLARGGWSSTHGLWGDERDALLRRTKLLLNISRHPGNYADSRLGLGAVYGAVVVSEPLYGAEPWVAGVHYEEAPLDGLPALIGELLRDDERRARIAAAAGALVREHTMAVSALGLLSLMEEAERLPARPAG
jgi:hypothetical protein